MDDWRQSHHRAPPRHGKPPPHPPGLAYNHSVPAWEKRFCTSVCAVPWRKICDAKAALSIYKNIADWDDSGALEAFHNAKARFWAEINGSAPSLVPLPDPDLYIDKVDYYATVDPKLVADLENDRTPPSGGGCIIFADRPVPGSGWGDAEEDPLPSNKPIVPTGWGDEGDSVPQINSSSRNGVIEPGNRWDSGNAWNHSAHNNGWDSGGRNNNRDARNAWNHSAQNNPAADSYTSCWNNKRETGNGWDSGGRNRSGDSGNAWNHSADQERSVVQSNSWGGRGHDLRDNGWDSGRGTDNWDSGNAWNKSVDRRRGVMNYDSWGGRRDWSWDDGGWNFGFGDHNRDSGNASNGDQGRGGAHYESWGGRRDGSLDTGRWDSGCGINNRDSGNARNHSAARGHGDSQNNSWGGGQYYNSRDNGRNGSSGDWEDKNNSSGRRNSRKRDESNFGFRSMKPRYRADNHQIINRWDDKRFCAA